MDMAPAIPAEAEPIWRPSPRSALDSPTRRHGRHLLGALVVAAIVLVGAASGAAPAGATTNGWYQFDADRNGYKDTAIWYSNGRPMDVYQDTNRNFTYDVRITISAAGTPFGYFDTNHNGTWDTWLYFWGTSPWLVLSNANEIGGYDSLKDIATAREWRFQGSSGGVSHVDPYFGMSWSDKSSFLTGFISSPTFDGNISIRLTQITGLAGSMHCYNYPNNVGCRR